ncbi:SDR family NAD(P)-dependent oxidoreductase [Stenotrophomonas maltophilia]|uniref:SDR family NAD(P)-dependent oxidoreductase n=1 Tax=Stenotrophomonas maltophilia TaxID=40324 RepID=UPI0012AF1EBA|nr:SDR family oxidoreductase [Stenotrophomonas maltophilia]MBH1655495.1 SDR family oxidoreductase [Stenotrophomonas maltophilia]MBH1843581.1 SDR family oxidoreductase [Stenotrophomonas maltophilia]QGM05582.1 SDR family oxidoreductase [Stenotrophomonas maltophilia]
MQLGIQNKVAVVTGATQGIGYAIASTLLAEGATVVVNGRRSDQVDQAVARLKAEHGDAAPVQGVVADLASAAGCNVLLAQVPACDILVNNAAVFETADFFEIADDTWDTYWAVNIMAGMRLARSYLPAMADKAWGRVVFIGSECGISTPPDMLHYATTKTALLGLSRGMAKRMAGTGVTVNAVLPGPTLSEGVEAMLQDEIRRTGKSIEEQGAALVKAMRPSSITERFQTAQEVANLVAYTCSSLASGTTGAALRADGGVADTPF